MIVKMRQEYERLLADEAARKAVDGEDRG